MILVGRFAADDLLKCQFCERESSIGKGSSCIDRLNCPYCGKSTESESKKS